MKSFRFGTKFSVAEEFFRLLGSETETDSDRKLTLSGKKFDRSEPGGGISVALKRVAEKQKNDFGQILISTLIVASVAAATTATVTATTTATSSEATTTISTSPMLEASTADTGTMTALT